MEEMLMHSRTKRFDIPLGHIDFDYVKKCTNIKEVERILRILRSGEEGVYPELQQVTEHRLEELDPKNILLRKATPAPSIKDIDKDERNALTSELQDWMYDMKSKDDSLKTSKSSAVEDEDSSLPPIRGEGITIMGDGEIKRDKNKKRVMPRDYKEWDKIDLDQELERIDKEDKSKTVKSSSRSVKDLSPKVDTTGLTEEEKTRKAMMEKDKGNEAFNSGDYEESIMYYSRSISIQPQTASYNNRALAYLKMSKWDYALTDLELVLKKEPNNVKALLRTGMAYKGKKRYEEAKKCFRKVLQLEPVNKRAKTLLEEAEKEGKKYKAEKEERKVKGHRMKIEDVSDSEEVEEVEQKVVNGWEKPAAAAEETSETVKGNGGLVKENDVAGHARPAEQPTRPANKASKDIWQDDEVSEDAVCESSTLPTSNHTTGEEKSTGEKKSTGKVKSAGEKKSVSKEKSAGKDKSAGEAKSVGEKASTGEKSTLSSEAQSGTDVDSQAAAASVSSPVHSRPVLYRYPMSPICARLREEGNTLFRTGQYAEASEKYEQAIKAFGKVTEKKTVNLSLVYSNLAACKHKTGNCSSAIDNATKALDLVPHSIKPLLRRAAAYEAMELYAKAYIDFKHILSIDCSVQQAHQGSSRCQHALSDRFGTKWRETIPPLVKVNAWDIPQILEVGPDGKKPAVPVVVESSVTSTTQAAPSTQAVGTTTQNTPCGAGVNSTTPNTHNADGPSTSENVTAESGCVENDAADSCVECPDPDGCYQQFKLQGNELVQKSNFKEAVECYTKCIEIFPDRAVGYTNRALCYIRLNQAQEAHADCCKALELEAENTKALYRNAQAKKMMHQYKESLQDLFTLLKLEPNNVAAKKEVEIVKKYYKEELEKVKGQSAKTTPPKKEHKTRKKMNIIEVDEEEGSTEHKKSETKSPVSSKPPSVPDTTSKQSKVESSDHKPTVKGNKVPTSPVSDTGTQSGKKSKNKSKSGKAGSASSPPAEPTVPKLEKASPYEFIQAWNSLKSSQGIQPYAQLLRNVEPKELPRVISKHFDGTMLQKITACVKNDILEKKEFDRGYNTLFHLCKVSRFGTVSMFMSKAEKSEMKELLDVLASHKSGVYSASDVDHLREKYSVKG